MTGKKQNKYQKKIRVSPSDLDALNHVNNRIYLDWVNEISKGHWEVLSEGKFKEQLYWVVLRHEIDYLKPAFLGEQLTIETWVGESKGARSIRYVRIKREEDILVEAKSTWCLISAENNRPMRIENQVLKILYPST